MNELSAVFYGVLWHPFKEKEFALAIDTPRRAYSRGPSESVTRGDRRRRELGLESRRRRSLAHENQRREFVSRFPFPGGCLARAWETATIWAEPYPPQTQPQPVEIR